jgi:hypothetical protein
MADINFYINNVLVPPPEAWQNLELELSFENNSPDATVRTINFEWKGENAKRLNDWFQSGLLGSYGIFEGIPFRMEVCNNPSVVCFDGCIDMTSPSTTFTCDIVTASVKETNRIQFLADKAESFTFAYLANPASATTSAPGFSPITVNDYIPVPYVIYDKNYDYMQIPLVGVSIIEMVNILKAAWQTLNKLVDDYGVGVAAIAAGASVYAVLQIAALIIEVLLYMAYILFIILIIASLILSILNNTIGLVKYKYGMNVNTLFTKACAYLGLKFQSSILQTAPYNNLVIIPRKNSYIGNATFVDAFFTYNYNRKTYDDKLNTNSYGYYEGTFRQLIMDIGQVFNARTVIRNGILFFERWDFWNLQAGFTMPLQSSEAPFSDPYGTNASELSSNYELRWTQDSSDTNTMNEYDGTTCQMTLLPKVQLNIRNNLLKGLMEYQLPFALAKSKKKTTVVEDIVNILFQIIALPYTLLATIVNSVIVVFGGNPIPTLPSNIFSGRIDMMVLSSDFTSIPKLLVIDPSTNKVDSQNNSSNHEGYTDAYRLQILYHSASWAVNTLTNPVTYPNQYLTFKNKEIPLCCSDFSVLRNNNIITTIDQKKGRVDSIKWNPHFETAKIDYRINETFTKNLSQNFTIDGQ